MVNARRIVQRDPIGHFLNGYFAIEMRGPLFQGRHIEVWTVRETPAEAVAEAERLGPMTDEPDEPSNRA
jgi:hypothetical protein